MSVLAKVLTAIEQGRMLMPGDRVVVALSGGADSVTLLHVMLQLQNRLSLREIAAVHVNHELRGEESRRDEEFVRTLCRDWQVPLQVYHRNVAFLAREAQKGIEETGRMVRYAVFDEMSAAYGDCPVATAHTLSDSAETLLLHLARGCGVHGLTGIPPIHGRVIRPLLSCTRREIEEYCHHHGLSYQTDSTNADVRYARNRIRNRVIPELRALNPRFEQTAARLMHRMDQVAEWLDRLAEEELDAARMAPDTYNRRDLQRLPPPVKAQALRLAADRAGGSCEERHVTRLEQMLDETGGCSLPGKVRAAVSVSALRFFRENEDREVEWGPIPVHPGSSLRIIDKNYRVFLLSSEELDKERKIHRKLLKNSFDYDKIVGSLSIRRRQPGDAYHPVGRQGGKSLKKLFNEAGIPPEARSRIPLLCDDAGILLIPGFGCDVRAAADANTKRLLVFEESTDE